MTHQKPNQMLAAILMSLLVASVLVNACSSESNDEPSSNSNAEGGSAGENSTGGKTSSKGGSSTGKGGSAGTAGKATNEGGVAGSQVNSSAGNSSTGGTGVSSTTTGSSACVPDASKNCYSCTPEDKKSEQFLNACNASGERPKCKAYDNSKLTKLVNGTVPALP